MGARVAADLGDAVARRERVDSAAALDELVLGRGALGGDEHLVLALGADRGRGHLDVLVLRARPRPGGRARSCPRARPRMGRARPACRNEPSAGSTRRERRGRARPARPWRRRRPFAPPPPAPPRAQAPVAGEAPRAVHEHAHADPLGLGVVEPLDSLVAGPDDLGPAYDDACVGVAAPAPRAAATAWSHSSRTARTLVRGEPRGEGVATMPPRAGGGIGRRARLRALWG